MPIRQIDHGDGYQTTQGLRVNAPPCNLKGSTAFAEGQTVGEWFELGNKRILNAEVEVSAVSGTSPTLTVTVQTSNKPNASGYYEPRTVAAFDVKSAVGLALTAVTAAGTTPPTITLSGTANRYLNLRIECTTLGARGTAVIRYSVDGGVSWVSAVTTAATILILDTDGVSTGVTINYAAATAAVDNVWTAKSAGFERRSFQGCDRFARIVAQVGGTSTPIVTAAISGEAV